jgi:serine/threonine-protein kinase RsbW
MAEIPNVRLSLANSPENVLVVRQALTGAAECVALDAIETNDLNTAVTEACNNVVLHAYEGGEGPLEVDLLAHEHTIAVVVRDHGVGMLTRAHDDEDDHTGLGIPVIEALSNEVQFTEPATGGTEVRMEFATPKAAALEPIAGDTLDCAIPTQQHALPSTVELRLAPNTIARTVLPRVLSVLAARAHFSTDRISDVRLVAYVLAANGGDSLSGSHLDVGITVAPRNLELRLGPLLTGSGESMMAAAADGLAPVIERLTDGKRVAPAHSGPDAAETLELRLVDQR